MKLVLHLSFILPILSGCTLTCPSVVELDHNHAPQTWPHTENALQHLSLAIEQDLGLKAGEAKPTTVIESLSSRYPSSPQYVDEFFALWLKGSCQRREYFDLYAPDGRGEIIEQAKLSEMNQRYRLACLPHDFTRHPFRPAERNPPIRINTLLDATKKIMVPDSFGSFEVLATSQDLKWAETLIYWLVQIASKSPEYLSADNWSNRRRTYAQKVSMEFPDLVHLHANTGEVIPCFEWDESNANLPISRHAQLYFAAELAPEDSPFTLNHESALFWAVTLTLRFKSHQGARQLMLFRQYQALAPSSTFWNSAEKAMHPLLLSTESSSVAR